MDREILFRGRTESGEWVEGDLHQIDGHCFIRVDEGFQSISIKLVDPATVGQFTGLYDANKKRIFEGDIVKAWETIYKVVFRDGMFELSQGAKEIIEDTFVSFWQVYGNEKEIIGTIHDNPELMEVKQC
jgi:uncharacterized phage protein (TIGR01671 family)